ncbi:Protein SUPPRESSOR OF npr1-1, CONSTITUTIVE 1 [Morella rubra]|uniref:Protein SUPPRESSOR OF npr1-1, CONSTITUTIVE 1 n=1 Tax=Morella rubra TaxID=262757 RepID=A0A6A1VPT2_9ROSI|nr:Protein SUPPRESSOR OF npr1-1, CONSTITUTIVE 1 [Morella rubra]
MTIVQFYQCKFLTEVPDFSSIPNLEELTLQNCKGLVEVHDSVGFLDKLVFLSLQGCSNLTTLPRSLKLRSLKWLDLGGCSSLENFPEIKRKMERLRCIIIEHCGIKELPSSIGYLIGLHYLYLEGCKNLVDLPSCILQLRHLESLSIHCSEPPPAPVDSSILNDGCFSEMVLALEILKARNCVIPRSDFLMRLHCFSKLEELDLSGSDIVSLPTCIKRLVGLISLHLDYCKKLKEILELPQNIRKGSQNLLFMDFSHCKFLRTIPDLTRIPNLKELILSCCENLVEVHNSVGYLDKLVFWLLDGCSSLRKLPRRLKLRSLEWLNLEGCSRLQNFPEIERGMEHLHELHLNSTAIEELPSSIGYLIGLSHFVSRRLQKPCASPKEHFSVATSKGTLCRGLFKT